MRNLRDHQGIGALQQYHAALVYVREPAAGGLELEHAFARNPNQVVLHGRRRHLDDACLELHAVLGGVQRGVHIRLTGADRTGTGTYRKRNPCRYQKRQRRKFPKPPHRSANLPHASYDRAKSLRARA